MQSQTVTRGYKAEQQLVSARYLLIPDIPYILGVFTREDRLVSDHPDLLLPQGIKLGGKTLSTCMGEAFNACSRYTDMFSLET